VDSEVRTVLSVEDIDHPRTKRPKREVRIQMESANASIGTLVDEFYRVAFRKKIYRTIDELQSDLDGWVWVKEYNETRPPRGRWCYGKTPMQTFLDALPAHSGDDDHAFRCIATT